MTTADHLQAGDLMQSSLSRVTGWLRAQVEYEPHLPYEVRMAMLEGDDAVEAWTAIRGTDR